MKKQIDVARYNVILLLTKGLRPMFNIPQTAPYAYNAASMEAARNIEPKLPNLRQRVYDAICKMGNLGATSSELADALGETRDAVQPRTTELCKAGYIEASGKKRPNQRGNNETVWIATQGKETAQ